MSPVDEVKDNWYNSSEARSNSSAYATADHPASFIGQNVDSAFQPIQPSRYILQPSSSQMRGGQSGGSGDESRQYDDGQSGGKTRDKIYLLS